MSPTDNQRAFQEMAERFTREKIVPGYMEREKTGHVDRGLVQEMGNLGLLGPDPPEKYGDLGEPSVTTGIAMEQLRTATSTSVIRH